MVADESIKSVRVNRLALILLTVIATIIGLAPIVLLLDRPHLLLYFAIGAAVLAALFSFTPEVSETSATDSPGFLEFLLGGLGAIFTPALLGTLWVVLYWVIYGVAKLVELLAVWAGWQVQPNADLIAFYPTVVLAALFGIGFVLISEQNMAGQLYPDTAGIKSAFYELLAQERRRLIGCTSAALLVLGVALAVFMAAGSTGKWFHVLLQLYLLVVSAPLSMLGTETTRPRETVDTVEDISQLFEAAGYQVERFPRTGSADVDPLLISLDLFAQRSGHNVVVDVRTASESTEPVDWKAGTGLTMATWALSKQRDLSPEDVDPLLVLVDDVKPDESLVTFSKKERVKILSVASEDVKRVLGEGIGAEERQEVARKLLGVPAGGPDDVTESPVSPGRGGRM
jgi:hypothetical protein